MYAMLIYSIFIVFVQKCPAKCFWLERQCKKKAIAKQSHVPWALQFLFICDGIRLQLFCGDKKTLSVAFCNVWKPALCFPCQQKNLAEAPRFLKSLRRTRPLTLCFPQISCKTSEIREAWAAVSVLCVNTRPELNARLETSDQVKGTFQGLCCQVPSFSMWAMTADWGQRGRQRRLNSVSQSSVAATSPSD